MIKLLNHVAENYRVISPMQLEKQTKAYEEDRVMTIDDATQQLTFCIEQSKPSFFNNDLPLHILDGTYVNVLSKVLHARGFQTS